MKELFGRYAIGVIAEAVYGIDAKVFDTKIQIVNSVTTCRKALQSKFELLYDPIKIYHFYGFPETL